MRGKVLVYMLCLRTISMRFYLFQQTILNADGAHDYMIDCAASGEPLITSMSPEIDPHPTTLEQTLIKKLVGPPKHHSAWEVRFYAVSVILTQNTSRHML